MSPFYAVLITGVVYRIALPLATKSARKREVPDVRG